MKKEKIDGYSVFDFGTPCTKIESYNTNNAWGFGGGSGLQYTFNNMLYAKIGSASYRHSPSTKYITLYKLNPEKTGYDRIFDENDNPKNRVKLIELIKTILDDKTN